MIDKVSIDRVNSLPIEQVAEALGLRVKRHWSLCPFHNDSRPSLYYRVAQNKYRCYVCEHYGGPIDLTMHMMQLNFHDAVCWLAQAFGISITDEHIRRFEGLTPRAVTPDASSETPVSSPLTPGILAQLVVDEVLTEEARHFLFDIRKLDPRVIRWCKLSSTHEHLLIPYFGIDGHLKSVQWRYLGTDKSKPRFLFPKGLRCPIYNLQILLRLHEGEPLYVTEGCSDCWAMLSSGHKAIAIPSATLLKPDDWQQFAALITSLSTPLHMYPDQDRPGEHLFLQLRDIAPQVIRHQLPEGCKDYAEYWIKQNEK